MKKQQSRPIAINRRTFVKSIGIAGGAMLLRGTGGTYQANAQVPGGSLDPTTITKYASPLFRLPVMPRKDVITAARGPVDFYEVAIRQVRQQMLPAGLPPTTVWAYGSPGAAGSFHTPAFSVEARWGRPVRVKWINDLVDTAGKYLPPLLPTDQTLHWADPGHQEGGDGSPYTGPVPDVTHLHGAHVDEESDGYPEMWFLPNANNIPAGYSKVGPWYQYFADKFYQKHGAGWEPGSAMAQYRNDQAATALWFHAHALGVTRLNMYAGLSGMYLLRGGPSDQVGGVLPGKNDSRYEVPLVIQDRCFNSDGSLFYPDSRVFFDGFAGPYKPSSDIPPLWNPEVFGNSMVVNGNTWPFLRVERRRYRFRILNACNARVILLTLSNGTPIWQIGSDGGFLPEPAMLDRILLAPSERADVIIDFSRARAGERILMLNLGPDEPFGGGTPGVDFNIADPDTTGQVMQFRVVSSTGADVSTPPDRLKLPPPPEVGTVNLTRQVSFNELDSAVLPNVGPQIGLLGEVDLSNPDAPAGTPMRWMDQVTETPIVGSTEIWEVYDFTEDAHPFHLHQVEFEILNREVFDPLSPDRGVVRAPEAWERGRKDTVIIYPGEITRVKAHFDIVGRYVWHCHMVEHEDNEMMRPCEVMPAA
ncbi:MAG TPA: multicopper oxidase [Verrucomicrobiae bacterium]